MKAKGAISKHNLMFEPDFKGQKKRVIIAQNEKKYNSENFSKPVKIVFDKPPERNNKRNLQITFNISPKKRKTSENKSQNSSLENGNSIDSNDAYSEDEECIEKPLLSSLNVTDTIKAALDRQVDYNILEKISQRHRQEVVRDQQRGLCDLAIYNQIIESDVVQRRRLLDEEEEIERSFNEEIERKRSLLRDTHHRHAQAMHHKKSMLDSLKQNEEAQEREKASKLEEEERLLKRLETENDMLKVHISTMVRGVSGKQAVEVRAEMEEKVTIVQREWMGVQERERWRRGREGGGRVQACQQINQVYREVADRLEQVVARESQAKREMIQATLVQQPPTSTATSTSTQENIGTSSILQRIQENSLSECRKKYIEHLKRFETVKEECLSLNTDVKYKKYRFELTSAVGKIISTLNSQQNSPLSTILQLLNGDAVVSSGRQRVSTKQHPAASLFCVDKLAKKIAEQATEASKENSALYVSLALQLASSHPSFSPLISSHLAIICPVSVPFQPEKGDSEGEYFASLGYRVDEGGCLEDENIFLARQSSYMSLYARLMMGGRGEGWSLGGLWQWLSCVLNQPPLPGLTATALQKVLSVAQRSLLAKYQRQYLKLLRFIRDVYMEKIDKVSEVDKKGPVVRLKSFIEGALKKGGIFEE